MFRSQAFFVSFQVLKAGLEGLVLKSINSFYEPGKRGWIKIKKDYLFQGQMADSADLVVLGGWFGTGKKGGMLSIFLMGCLDSQRNQWRTVTKVHSGLDDSTLDELQTSLLPLMQRPNPDRPPNWLSCKKQLMPDYLAVDPTKMPVWEITGAEFTKAEVHTANGISIRFPRITKMRDDKSVSEATNLEELELLFKNSKEHINVDMLFKDVDEKDVVDMVDIKTKLFDLNRSFDDDDGGEEMKDDDDVKGDSKGNESSSSIARKRRSSEQRDDSQCSPKKKMKKLKTERDGSDMKYSSISSAEKKSEGKVNMDCSGGKSKLSKHQSMEEDEKSEKKAIKIKRDPDLIFADIQLYVRRSELTEFKLKQEFFDAGGKLVEDSRKATHAVHMQTKSNEDFMALR